MKLGSVRDWSAAKAAGVSGSRLRQSHAFSSIGDGFAGGSRRRRSCSACNCTGRELSKRSRLLHFGRVLVHDVADALDQARITLRHIVPALGRSNLGVVSSNKTANEVAKFLITVHVGELEANDCIVDVNGE